MNATKQCVARLYRYRDALYRLKSLGSTKVFSSHLASAVGSNSSQVRKDFSIFSISGNKRGGYVIDCLIDQLNALLGKNKTQDVVIVGAGHIGRALMHYDGFAKEGIRIVAAFDIDPLKYGQETLVPIFPLDQLSSFIKKKKIKIGIIAVPYFAAQQVVDSMILAGIEGVLNFAPISLKVPDNFIVNNVNVRLELEVVNYFVDLQRKKK
ncbi:MAG: redox-sensing transcriptional repressor Rex [Candidatus Omnitrophica bacterium]|nr:redox-sensing transcriptional repressor Rex [Candidatus Omnitrophota bacterium]